METKPKYVPYIQMEVTHHCGAGYYYYLNFIWWLFQPLFIKQGCLWTLLAKQLVREKGQVKDGKWNRGGGEVKRS